MATASDVAAHEVAPQDVRAIGRRSVRVLALGQGLGGVAVAGSLPAGSLLAASTAGSEAAAGLAQTAGVLGAALLALPMARIALGRGRRPALTLGYGTGAIGAVLVIVGAVQMSLVVLLVGCLAVGAASAASYQARYAATDLADADARGRWLAWVVWAATIGAVLGPNLLGVSGDLGSWLGLPRLAGPYVVCGLCLGVTVVVLVTRLRPDPYRVALAIRGESTARAPRLRDGLAHLRGRPRAVLGIVVIAIGHVVMVMVMVMTPVHMAHVDVSLQVIGLVISVHVAGMYACSPLVGWAVDRLGRLVVAWIGVGILIAACAIAGVAPQASPWQLGIGLFLLGLGWSCTLISGSTLVTDSTAAQERPAVQGLSDLVMNGAGAVGGALAGIIVLVASYAALCAVALVPLMVLVIMLLLPACRQDSNTRSI